MIPTLDEIKANREAWYANLLSGKYKQGQGWLRDVDDYHCCLGVLCRTLQSDESSWIQRGSYFVFGGNFTTRPPRELTQKVGLSDAGIPSLMSKNDSGNWSFEQLVSDMRAKPELYFKEGTF